MQHYTGRTQSVSRYCRKCRKHTQHRVDNHVVTNVCLDCQEKACQEKAGRNPQSPELIPIVAAEIPAPCTCRKYPFGHYHAIGDFQPRFKPGTWEENRA